MTRRSGWIWAIVVVVVLAAAGAVALMAVSASMTAEAEAYFTATYSSTEMGPVEVLDPARDEYYNALFVQGSEIFSGALPLLQVAIAGPFVLLAVLAARRDGQTEAPAAS